MSRELFVLKSIPKNPIKLGFAVSRHLWKYAFISLFCVFAAVGLARFTVIILKNLTDLLVANPVNVEYVVMWAIVFPVVFLFEEIIWRLSGFTGMYWFMNLRAITYQSLFEYVTRHSKEYFSNRLSGSLTNKISNAVDGVESLFENALWQFLTLILGLCWYIVYSFINDYRLGLIIIIWSFVFFGFNIWFSIKLKTASVKNAQAESALKGRVVDALSNISLVHEYAYLTGEQNYIKSYVEKARLFGIKHWKLSEWMLTANAGLILIFICLMLSTSIYLFNEKVVTAGVIIMVIAITLDLSRQLLFLGQQFRSSAKLYGDAREGLDEILHQHQIVDANDAKELIIEQPSIEFNNIVFEYENIPIFNNFNLNIKPGQKIGIVGKSGAGKTTITALLLRHYDLKSGDIKISGQDISKVKLASLRKSIGYVPQDTSLFHRTIKENIGYSNQHANDKDIIEAARLAHAHDFIQDLPNGYESMVGERGVKLSGGQKQRIAIARAFLKNAPIIVLDEATSSLDTKSEEAIQDSLEKLMKGRTVIAIAHRLSTLKNMDRIIVIDEGKILEDGHPNELLKNSNGIFKTLWDHQVKGFILDE